MRIFPRVRDVEIERKQEEMKAAIEKDTKCGKSGNTEKGGKLT